MFGDSRDAEIIADAADRDHQNIVGIGPLRHDHLTRRTKKRREANLFLLAVKTIHPGQHKAEIVFTGLCQIFKLVIMGIEGSRRHLVQQRLPNMRATAINEGDLSTLLFAQTVSELGH